MMALLEIFICGGGEQRNVQLFVNGEELFDTLSFLRYVVVPVAIMDAFKSAWRAHGKVIRKNLREAVWEEKDDYLEEKAMPSLKKRYSAEIAYCKVFFLKLMVLPCGATLLFLLGSDLAGFRWNRESVFRNVFFLQHKSFIYVFLCETFMKAKRFVNSKAVHYGVTLSKQMTKFAMFHPKRFAHRISQLKVFLRWLKFSAPLIGELKFLFYSLHSQKFIQ